ncbi:hypothetical protein CHS0354_021124 [Potamilus streckersoni]|uniref:Kringle domain-containing protein n=1 Tax=Potamilus streckersoni TaxID=2493646 RepID=A0AAE0T5W9_9BIVA|nr:hypothetical protein CHS0354_021124 [Potamilus streckersoni]
MLIFFGVLFIIMTSVGTANIALDSKIIAKPYLKLLLSEIETCVNIASVSCTKGNIIHKLYFIQSILTKFDEEFEGCFTDSFEYTGRKNHTESGLECMEWSSTTPHDHHQTNFPDDSIEKARNYCRDPDRSGKPWCYTIDPNVRYQTCSVQRCDTFE